MSCILRWGLFKCVRKNENNRLPKQLLFCPNIVVLPTKMRPTDANGKTNSVDPDQSSLSWVYIVYPCMNGRPNAYDHYSIWARRMTKPAKWLCAQISLNIRPVWSESSLSAWGNIGRSEDSDLTRRMPRLIWVVAGHTSFCWFCHAAVQLELSLSRSWVVWLSESSYHWLLVLVIVSIYKQA